MSATEKIYLERRDYECLGLFTRYDLNRAEKNEARLIGRTHLFKLMEFYLKKEGGD